jgi:hypothetical protein
MRKETEMIKFGRVVRSYFGCNDRLIARIEDAEEIIRSYDTMLNLAHLSERRDSACMWARGEIEKYKRKWL